MIEFHDVSKNFAGHAAVSHLNLNFEEGAFSVLIGTWVTCVTTCWEVRGLTSWLPTVTMW